MAWRGQLETIDELGDDGLTLGDLTPPAILDDNDRLFQRLAQQGRQVLRSARPPSRVAGPAPLDSWEWLEDPGFPIPPDITNITGITNEIVAGHSIDDQAVNDLLKRVVLVIAHNAAFDRRFLEKPLPPFVTKHWACSRSDIDWRAKGIRSSALEFVA
jgi:DNA polymerase III epsilon subunit-like protein